MVSHSEDRLCGCNRPAESLVVVDAKKKQHSADGVVRDNRQGRSRKVDFGVCSLTIHRRRSSLEVSTAMRTLRAYSHKCISDET